MRINNSVVELIKTMRNNGNQRFEQRDNIRMNKQIRRNRIMNINIDIDKNTINVSDGKKKEATWDHRAARY